MISKCYECKMMEDYKYFDKYSNCGFDTILMKNFNANNNLHNNRFLLYFTSGVQEGYCYNCVQVNRN